jgi:hypothetical protein
LLNLTEDRTSVHETDCIGEIKPQNVTCLGFLTSSILFSTPRVLRSLKAAETTTPDIRQCIKDVLNVIVIVLAMTYNYSNRIDMLLMSE